MCSISIFVARVMIFQFNIAYICVRHVSIHLYGKDYDWALRFFNSILNIARVHFLHIYTARDNVGPTDF
jgi:hypothetical protein